MAVEMRSCTLQVGTLRIGNTVQLLDDAVRWKITRIYHAFGLTQVDLHSSRDRNVEKLEIPIDRIVAITDATATKELDPGVSVPTFSGKTVEQQTAMLEEWKTLGLQPVVASSTNEDNFEAAGSSGDARAPKLRVPSSSSGGDARAEEPMQSREMVSKAPTLRAPTSTAMIPSPTGAPWKLVRQEGVNF